MDADCAAKLGHPSDRIAVELRIDGKLFGYLAREAARRGHAIGEEIVRRLESTHERDVRSQAVDEIDLTVKATDTTIGAVERLLRIVNSAGPKDPQMEPR